MVSLKIKDGGPIVVQEGSVEVMGNFVAIFERSAGDIRNSKRGELVHAYCMYPGERVRRLKEGEYIVEF